MCRYASARGQARSRSVIDTTQLNHLNAPQLREVVRSLMGTVVAKDREIAFKQAKIVKITHEMATLKRLKFAPRSEASSIEQKSLIEETIDADLAALQADLDTVLPGKHDEVEKKMPKRQALPAHLPRREFRHEPESTTCACGCALKRTGEDVAEKLEYAPGVFTVERHVSRKRVCMHCETLVRAPVAPHIIDKGIPTAGLLAELQPLVDALTSELLRHDVLHADETPVAMLKPGNGKTHRTYLWSYCTTRYAKAIDYGPNRWAALTRYFDDGDLPADNNWVENQIRPIAIARSRNNWLFAGSLSAANRIQQLLPHRWSNQQRGDFTNSTVPGSALP